MIFWGHKRKNILFSNHYLEFQGCRCEIQKEMSRAFLHYHSPIPTPSLLPTSHLLPNTGFLRTAGRRPVAALKWSRRRPSKAVTASIAPLDLTEDNVRQVLADARVEASHRRFPIVSREWWGCEGSNLCIFLFLDRSWSRCSTIQ